MVSREPSVEELVAIAQQFETNPEVKSETRLLKAVELFIQDMGIENGSKLVHNLVLYDVYRQWAKEEPLSLFEFNKTFAYYFSKAKDSSLNLNFKLKTKYKGGKFITTRENITRCRGLYGRKKEKRKEGEGEIPESQSESEQN